MDLFNRKRIARLEAALAHEKELYSRALLEHRSTTERRIAALEASELRLMGTIRDMDTTIFAMSQFTTWEHMLPHFQDLLRTTMARRNAESERIAQVLIPEMQKAYREESNSLEAFTRRNISK